MAAKCTFIFIFSLIGKQASKAEWLKRIENWLDLRRSLMHARVVDFSFPFMPQKLHKLIAFMLLFHEIAYKEKEENGDFKSIHCVWWIIKNSTKSSKILFIEGASGNSVRVARRTAIKNFLMIYFIKYFRFKFIAKKRVCDVC